jgi:P pilus assembly chaperone PapD
MNKSLLVCLCAVVLLFTLVLAPAPALASVELSSTSLSFGSVDVNSSSSAVKVVITNESDRHSVSIESITSSSSQFLVSGVTLPLTLSPRSTTSFSAVFHPSAAQAYSGTITVNISTSSRYRSTDTIAVSGAGLALATQLLPSTSALSFGSAVVATSVSQSVSLSNKGAASVTVSGVIISGAGFAVSGFSRAVTLASGQSISLPVSFTPPHTGSMTATLTVSSNASNSPTSIALSGTGIQSQIAASPAALSFGNDRTGTKLSQTLTISNPGSSSLTITQAAISGAGFAYSGLSLPLTVAAGASSAVSVSFDPSAAGTASGTLTLVNNSATPTLSVSLSGTGVVPTLQLAVSPVSLSFGSVQAGSSTSKTVTLTNSGSGSLSLAGDSITGSGFTLSGLTLPLSLSAGQSTSFSVAFAPASSGSVTGGLIITSNAANSPATILLSGSGVAPAVSVTPESVAFGSVTTGVTNTQTLTISNPGTANLTVTQAALSGAGFAYTGLPLPLTVLPGGSSPFTVSFDPTAAGSFSGTLTLKNNSTTTPSVAVALTGSGTAAVLKLSVSPASLSFGNLTTGSSEAKTVTLTNTGNANVSLSKDTITGSGFAVSGLAAPLTLSPGQSTSFSVDFAPTAVGSVSGSLAITSDAANSPAILALTGAGESPTAYKVMLSWTPSSATYSGFNVYRSTVSGGPYSKLDSTLVGSASYTDTSVTSGQTYYYVATEVDSTGKESGYSAQTSATIP